MVLCILICAVPSFACTSVIISAKVSLDGRPLMMKHRDTERLDNAIEYFTGPKFNYIGLVNADLKKNVVWAGTNSAGFSIMNTASYNLVDVIIKESKMDKEGVLMNDALGCCASLKDFEKFLENRKKPLGVEANFGIIDAQGGAAYYEVSNTKWVKYDVNDSLTAPYGYSVVTNFSRSGKEEDYMGYERYLTASDIMAEIYKEATPSILFNEISRSYRHNVLGVDYLKETSGFNGIAVDQDFIPRRLTSASIVFQGVSPGEDPLHTVMWSVLGYPVSSVAIPLMVGKKDILPYYVRKSGDNNHSLICDKAMYVKMNHIFIKEISHNSTKYLKIRPDLVKCCKDTESIINDSFYSLYGPWLSGEIDDYEFFDSFVKILDGFYDLYLFKFKSYLQ